MFRECNGNHLCRHAFAPGCPPAIHRYTDMVYYAQ
jgi:hypothetical protein